METLLKMNKFEPVNVFYILNSRKKILGIIKLLFLFYSFLSNAYSQDFLKGFKKTESGLYYKVIKTSKKSEKVKKSSLLYINYLTKLNNDSVFDMNNSSTFTYLVGEAEGLKGWDEGLSLLHIGDSAIFIIPPHLAYKDKKVRAKLRTSTLIFHVKVLRQINLFFENDAPNDTILISEGVLKIPRKASSEKLVNSDAYVNLEFTGYIKTLEGHKRVFESSYITGNKAYFQLNGGFFIRGLEESISTMKIGEKASFIIDPEKGYGSEKKGLIPPNSKLFYDIHLSAEFDPFIKFKSSDTVKLTNEIKIIKNTNSGGKELNEEDVMEIDLLVYTNDNKGLRKIIFDSKFNNQKVYILYNSKLFCSDLIAGLKNFRSNENGLLIIPKQKCSQFSSKMDNNAKGLIYAQVDNIRILNYPFFPNTSKDTVFLDDKLKYLVVNKGDQNSPEFTDSCTIDLLYTGYYIKDGKKNIFSTSRELRKPLHFNYGSTLIIKGLTLATNKMRNKEARIVVIPYQLAYGEKGIPDASIPAKTDLIFEIEALKITTKHTKP